MTERDFKMFVLLRAKFVYLDRCQDAQQYGCQNIVPCMLSMYHAAFMLACLMSLCTKMLYIVVLASSKPANSRTPPPPPTAKASATDVGIRVDVDIRVVNVDRVVDPDWIVCQHLLPAGGRQH